MEKTKMVQIEVLERLKCLKVDIDIKYPKQQLLTDDIFKIITEMLSVDYNSISPGGKRINVFKEYMLSLIRQALENKGHKSYMLDLINVFQDHIILNYLCNSFGNKSEQLKQTIKVSHRDLFAWQGLEGCEWRRIERIEKSFGFIR